MHVSGNIYIYIYADGVMRTRKAEFDRQINHNDQRIRDVNITIYDISRIYINIYIYIYIYLYVHTYMYMYVQF